MRFPGTLRWLAVAFALVTASGAFAATPKLSPLTNRVKMHSAKIEPEKAAPGGSAKVVIDFEVMPGYHAYAPSTPSSFALKLEVKLPEDSKFKLDGALVHPTPKVHVDQDLGETFHELTGRFKIEQPIRLPADAKSKLDFQGTLSGQACDNNSCDNFDIPLELDVTADPSATDVTATAKPDAAAENANGTQAGAANGTGSGSAGGSEATAGAGADPTAVPNTTDSLALPKTPANSSLFAFLLTAIGAGLISLLMPCVFPMIPITVSVFTKQAAGSRGSQVRLAAIYGISIIVVFTAIGVLCSIIGGAGGANTIGSNPWINLVLGALFVVFALSLLGAFELRLPSFLINKAAAAQDKATGVAQVVLMAIVFTLTSFTCTVPFVGGLLVQAATGEYTWPLLGMLAFSSTFALPFFLLALSPGLMSSLPSAGNWMNSAKIVMGLVEFAFALKFMSNADLVWNLEILTRPAYLSAWVVIGLVVTLYLLGRLKVGYDLNEEPIGPYRMVLALLFGSTTLYLATGFLGTRFGDTIEGLLPPSEYGMVAKGGASSGGGEERLAFLPSYKEGLALAKQQNKPLFIDFTGITCVNCRAMEERVFPLPEVRQRLEQFVRVQLYVDKGPEKDFNKELQLTRFRASAQPYYAVLDPKNEETLEVYPGYASTPEMRAEFIAKLDSAAKKFAAR